ncbi:MAG: winged helix-turn-helix domain-containing protein [Hyphomicrobiaceae bacterium]
MLPRTMPPNATSPLTLTTAEARRIWLRAQRLDTATPFGDGPDATRRAVEHLGYVQIDTINVIERCHHHILFSRIPAYQRAHLQQAQSLDKSVFEYWTHALSYVPTSALRYYLPEMRRHAREPRSHFATVKPQDRRKVLTRIRTDGPLTIRDIDDDELVEKDHPWASRKPSKRALQLAFYSGDVTVSARTGMLKSYELMGRHFGWEKRPAPASPRDIAAYVLGRALKAQGVVSLDSICYLDAKRKAAVRAEIDAQVRRKQLRPVQLEGCDGIEHWIESAALDMPPAPTADLVHILSPFDPLIIQRKRLLQVFGYEHRFEAYVPKEKRVLGYFALPVLVGDQIVAALDLKTDRAQRQLLIQQWTWIERRASKQLKARIEDALDRFEAFQLA